MLLRPRAAHGRRQGVRPRSHSQGTFGPRGKRVRPVRGAAHGHSPGYSQRGRGILRSPYTSPCIIVFGNARRATPRLRENRGTTTTYGWVHRDSPCWMLRVRGGFTRSPSAARWVYATSCTLIVETSP